MIANKEIRGFVGSGIVFLSIMGLLGVLFFVEVPEKNNDIVKVIIGMLLTVWYNGITNYKGTKFSFTEFWNENGNALIYSIVGICIIVSIAPEATEIIKSITGFEFDVPITNGSAVFLGGFIYEMVRKSSQGKQ